MIDNDTKGGRLARQHGLRAVLRTTAVPMAVLVLGAAMSTSAARADSSSIDLTAPASVQTPADTQSAASKNTRVNLQLAQNTAPPEVGNTPAAALGPNATPAAPGSTEQVVVTGSRVRKTNLETESPVVTVTSTDIQARGLTNVADLLNELPQAGVSGLSNVNSNFSDDNAGITTINLRNLGTQRTLVLIDGRRQVTGNAPGAGEQAFDLSSIPTYLIDHVDVATGGGSSAYGSEADAGVVNIVLKKNYEGVQINQQLGLSQYGDDKTITTDILAGTSFSHGDGHLTFGLEYNDEGAVYSKDRTFSANDLAGGDGTGSVYSPSSYTTNGTFLTDNGRYTTLSDGSSVPNDPATYGFNREPLRTISIPNTHLVTYSKLSYDITPDIEFFTDAKFARTTATNLLEPIAVGNSTTIGFGNDPQYSFLQLPINNAFVPPSLAAQGIVDDGMGNFASWRRRFVELGDRGGNTERYDYSVTSGLDGTIAGRYKWNAYYTYGQVTSSEVIPGSGNVINLQQELDGCTAPGSVALGCVPINIFGAGSISPQAVNYFKATKTYNDELSESDLEADINGPVLHLPYGDVQLAVGVEHRREEGSQTPDALSQEGLSLDTQGAATHGAYNVTDFFAEASVPVLKDLPFAKELSLSAGYRHSQYSLGEVGGQESYKYGGTYAPVKDVIFRVDNAVAIRAPNIDELYQGRSQSANSVNDPCSGQVLSGLPNSAQVAANCASFPGVVPGFTEEQANQQTEISYSGGNPNLRAERARVLTYGVALQPRWVPHLTATVDAFKYLIANAIQSIDLQTTAEQCAETLNPTFCDLVRRDTNPTSPTFGLIQGVDAEVINVGAVREQGVDVALNYELPVNALTGMVWKNSTTDGALDFSWNYEHLQYLNYISIPGVVTQQRGLFGAPANRWTFDTLFRNDKLQVNYQLRYTGSQRYDYAFGPAFGAFVYHDLSVRYQLTDNVAPYIGVNNLFNKQPPIVTQEYQQTGAGTAVGVTGTNTVPDVYDAIGRFIFFGVKITL